MIIIIIAVSGNSKPFWNYIKSKRNGTNTLVSLKVGDKELVDDESWWEYC